MATPRSKELLKIDALIARCLGTDSVEEARTSAVLACQLIRKYKIELYAPGTAMPFEPRVWQPPPPPPPPRPRSRTVAPETFRLIYAKYDTACRDCGGDIYTGERVAWKKGWGVKCLQCYYEA